MASAVIEGWYWSPGVAVLALKSKPRTWCRRRSRSARGQHCPTRRFRKAARHATTKRPSVRPVMTGSASLPAVAVAAVNSEPGLRAVGIEDLGAKVLGVAAAVILPCYDKTPVRECRDGRRELIFSSAVVLLTRNSAAALLPSTLKTWARIFPGSQPERPTRSRRNAHPPARRSPVKVCASFTLNSPRNSDPALVAVRLDYLAMNGGEPELSPSVPLPSCHVTT